MFTSQNQYFDAILSDDYKKPVVHYKPTVLPIIEGERASVKTVDHPAGYLNDAPWVSTSTVLSYDPVTGHFETRNTLYVPVEV